MEMEFVDGDGSEEDDGMVRRERRDGGRKTMVMMEMRLK